MKSVETKKKAIEMFKLDKELVEVANECDTTVKTARNWFKNWRDGTFRFERKKAKPWVKYTKHHIDYMKVKIVEDPFITIDGLVKKIKDNRRLKNLSAGTVAKIRSKLGKKTRIRVEPKLEPHHIEARLKFCLENRENAFRDWIFSDETIFELKPVGHYFKLKGSNRKVSPVPKERIKVMFWGAISFDNKFDLLRIDGKMNGFGYRKMLHNYFLKDYYKKQPKQTFFLQDNASPHSSKDSIAFLKMVGFNLVEHPPLSPDLNPIEIIWSWMKKEFNRYDCQTDKDVESAVVKIWKSLPQRNIRNVIEGLTKRVKHVIDIKGEFSSGELLNRKKLTSLPSKPDFERICGVKLSNDNLTLTGTKANTTE